MWLITARTMKISDRPRPINRIIWASYLGSSVGGGTVEGVGAGVGVAVSISYVQLTN